MASAEQLHEELPALPIDEARLPLHRAALRAVMCAGAAGALAAVAVFVEQLCQQGPALSLRRLTEVFLLSAAIGFVLTVPAGLLVAAEQASARVAWPLRPLLLLVAGAIAPFAALFGFGSTLGLVTGGADRAAAELERALGAETLTLVAPALPYFVVPVLLLGLARPGLLRGRDRWARALGGAAVGGVGGALGAVLHRWLWPPSGTFDVWLLRPGDAAALWAGAGFGLAAGEEIERGLVELLRRRED